MFPAPNGSIPTPFTEMIFQADKSATLIFYCASEH